MSENRKILFLITKATWGGAQRYVYDLTTSLPKERFEVVVAYGEGGRLKDELESAGVRTLQLAALRRDVSILADLRSFFQIRAAIRAEKPDIVHLNSSKAAAIGALAARISGVSKIVFTVHGWPFNERRNVFARAAFFLASWFTAALCHTVILVSRSDYIRAASLLGIGAKSEHIPVGIHEIDEVAAQEAKRFLLAASDFASTLPKDARLQKLSEQRLILTIAELTRNKGLTYGIEAMAELRRRGRDDFTYFIVGAGEMREKLQSVITAFNLKDRVFLLGFIPDAAKYLKGADYFLLPSIKEGLPYVLLEAAYAGVPVIASKVGGTTDVLEKYERCILVPPGTPTAIADGVLALEAKKGAPEDARVKQAFGLADMVHKTIELYG